MNELIKLASKTKQKKIKKLYDKTPKASNGKEYITNTNGEMKQVSVRNATYYNKGVAEILGLQRIIINNLELKQRLLGANLIFRIGTKLVTTYHKYSWSVCNVCVEDWIEKRKKTLINAINENNRIELELVNNKKILKKELKKSILDNMRM